MWGKFSKQILAFKTVELVSEKTRFQSVKIYNLE